VSKPLDERVVPIPTSPLGDRSAVAVMGDSRTDVAREALKLARAESQHRPVLLVDLLGQDSVLHRLFSDDDPHGVSDAARYGVSLSRLARPVSNSDGLFVVPGGLESPLADDVLSDHMWASWSEQCRRAGALLVVAAPADLPAITKAVDQLDGVVMIGDAPPPATQAALIGRVPARRVRLADVPEPRRLVPQQLEVVRQSTSQRTALLVLASVAGALFIGAGVWYALGTGPLGTSPPSVRSDDRGGVTPIVVPGDPGPGAGTILSPAEGEVAEWAVELANVSSMNGALTRVRQSLDALPVPTFTPIRPGPSSTLWYRLIAGAFPSMESADSLLAALRDRGVVEPGGGRVVRAPLAWLLEDAVAADRLPERLFAWRQQGLPAYALYGTAGTARIYVGAFATEDEGRLLQPVLDSLNLHATLAPRVGSLR
jgi:hypothetical protein